MSKIQANHPKLGEVTILRILPQRLPVTLKEPPHNSFLPAEDALFDELYYRRAIVVDIEGNEKVVPLKELLYQGKTLVHHVKEYEAIQNQDNFLPGERYLHRTYGVVEVISKYSNNYWRCRLLTSQDVMSEAKYNVDLTQFPSKKCPPTSALKEFVCHLSELIPLKRFKPKDQHLYAAYADIGAVAETKALYKFKRRMATPITETKPSAHENQPSANRTPNRRDDLTMKGIDEFLTILADLPRVFKTKKIGGSNGPLRTITYREAPRVIARGETTGRIYITPAWWLWRVTGDFKQSPYKDDCIGESGKVGERYRWSDPRTKEALSPPTWFSYDPESEEPLYDGFLFELPEESRTRNAWYWKLPPKTAREFSISRLSIQWLNSAGALANISLTYKGKDYTVPVYINPNNELAVKVKTRELAAFLCRYVDTKMAR